MRTKLTTFLALGRAMEAAQGPRAYKTRQLSRWGFFFRAHGTEIDHLYAEYGTLSYLIELTPFAPQADPCLFNWRANEFRGQFRYQAGATVAEHFP